MFAFQPLMAAGDLANMHARGALYSASTVCSHVRRRPRKWICLLCTLLEHICWPAGTPRRLEAVRFARSISRAQP